MKRTITALVLALTMLLGLTGCTSKKDNTDTPNSSTTQNGTTNNNGTTNGTDKGNTNNGTMNGGTNTDGGTVTPSDGSRYGTNDNNYGAPGYNSPSDSESRSRELPGRSYEQMLRDGRIHDSDGFLNDGENSVSEW